MTILVVDDELDIKDLFQQRFRREIRSQTLHFAFAHSAQQAMDYLNQHGGKDVLILSDINMPGMSGLDLLRRVRSDYPLPPPPVIMMITAYGDAPSYQQAMTEGANDFLSKPIDFEQLRAKLQPFVGQ
ncbi:response regulator [Spirosoma foliorum]|uniref:Response regulator n=1 Tax=Spirosoma foliorum TaxID=2710596 RepID=A0A7G5H0Y2_9BACT|nr:response regulator [Spirosoma foliorum]QMW04774.1 response regulator [Spirosoma foliorum]